MEKPLQFRVGKHTLQENLDRSIAEGRLIQHEDGTYEVPQRDGGGISMASFRLKKTSRLFVFHGISL